MQGSAKIHWKWLLEKKKKQLMKREKLKKNNEIF